MKEIGTFEAINQFSNLLDLVARGEDILITRDGEPAARLVPPELVRPKQEALAAAARIRQRAHAKNLGPFNWDEWKAIRDEGRL